MRGKYDGFGRMIEGTVWSAPVYSPDLLDPYYETSEQEDARLKKEVADPLTDLRADLFTALLTAAEAVLAEGDDLTVATMNAAIGSVRRLVAAVDAETDEEEAVRLKQEAAEYAEQEYLDAVEEYGNRAYDPS
jgi:hypothetical protein